MPAPSRARANVLILAVMLFAQLLLMSSSSRDASGTSVLESGVVRVTQPVLGMTRALGGGLKGVINGFREIRSARRENIRLRSEVERLQSALDRNREQALENLRLRKLLGMREDLAPKSVAASVVSTNLSGQTRMVLLDRGTESGVRTDLPVVAWGGAVGRVVFANKSFSKVRLLSDPNSGVAGVVQRSRAAGMVLGRGEGPLDMVYVPKYADVVVGDRVITSGLDGVFPRGFGIGRATLVGGAVGVSKNIRLEPEVDFGALEEVLVLLDPAGGALLAPPVIEEAR